VDRWWARSRVVRSGNQAVTGLSPEDLLVALLVHGSRHAWTSLRWVADVCRLCERTPHLDWHYVWNEHSHPDLRRMLGLGLLVAHDLAGAVVPGPLLDRVRQDRALERLAETVPGVLFQRLEPDTFVSKARDVAFQVRLRAGWTGRLRYLSRRTFSPPPADWALGLPSALFPLYFVLRPLLFLGRQSASVFQRRRR